MYLNSFISHRLLIESQLFTEIIFFQLFDIEEGLLIFRLYSKNEVLDNFKFVHKKCPNTKLSKILSVWIINCILQNFKVSSKLLVYYFVERTLLETHKGLIEFDCAIFLLVCL